MYNLLILAAEGAEEKEGIDLILPAVDELVWGTICFVVVAFFLMRIALPKIRESIAAREQAIQQAHEGAEGERAEAQKLLDDYKQQLAQARAEANQIIEEARSSAETVRKDILAKAEAESQQIVSRASEQIEAERVRTMDQLRGEVATLAVSLAEKVVLGEIDPARRKKLVDGYISEVGAMNGGANN
jgi:F-type H+-transporting ATPase subunit b